MPERTVLLITTDHVGWPGVRIVLHSLPNARIAGEATSEQDAEHLARTLNPDVIITAIRHEGASPWPFLSNLCAACPSARIVVIAAAFDPEDLMMLASLRIKNFLLWSELDSATARDLFETIVHGGVCVNSEVAVDAFLETLETRLYPGRGAVQLSERERAVLRGLAEGLTQKEIAAREGVSMATVKRIIANLQHKLDVPSPTALCYTAGRLGLV